MVLPVLVAQNTVQVALPPTWRHSIRWSPASPQCSQAALERVIKRERELLSWLEISRFPRSGTDSPSNTHWTTWLTQQQWQWKTQSIFSALCPATASQWESHTFPVGMPPCHKGWLAIAKLTPLSLFISLLSMPNEAFDNVKIEK